MTDNVNNSSKISDAQKNLMMRREEISQESRKINREESLMKKRKEKILTKEISFDKSLSDVASSEIDFIELTKKLKSDDVQERLKSTIKIRQLLSLQKDPPINEVIEAGLIPIFIEFLTNKEESQLQFEAAWILTNVASGSSRQTQTIVDAGGISLFINLLKSPISNIKEQSIWALGNITGDSPQNRDLVLESGILEPLIFELNFPNRLSFTRNAVWTLSNLCRGKPGPKLSYLKIIVTALEKFIFLEDTGILADACWAFSYISEGSHERIQLVIESGIILRITELLMHRETIVQTPALRVIGNIATGDDLQTQIIINCGALPCLLTLLSSYYKSIKKESCWTISNVTAGNPEQIQAVIDANIIPTLIYILKNSEMELKKEAAWAISNATSGGIAKQIDYLVKKDCLKPMIELLSSSDPRVIRVILDGLENILEIGNKKSRKQGLNVYAQSIEQEGGLEKIENLQHHPNNDIYEHSIRLLEKFFGAEEEYSEISENNIDNKNAFKGCQQIPDCSFGFVKK